jgi:hypothetical protein
MAPVGVATLPWPTVVVALPSMETTRPEAAEAPWRLPAMSAISAVQESESTSRPP